MHIEKGRSRIFHITISGYELAALISSARWAAEGAKGDLNPEAVNHLKQVLANYDTAASKLSDDRPQKSSS
jgi:hypothetical protein